MHDDRYGSSKSADHNDKLRARTVLIEESTRKLEAQIEALQALRATNSLDHSGTSNHDKAGSPDNDAKRRQSQLIDSLRANIKDSQVTSTKKLQKAITSTLIASEDTLSQHDYRYEQLEAILSGLESRENGERISQHTSKLLQALQHTQAQTIRARLNRRYLEVLRQKDATGQTNGHSEVDEVSIENSVAVVKDDLSTLYAEIDDVVQMLVMHEHGDHIREVNEALTTAHNAVQTKQTRQSIEQIRQMTEQMGMISDRAELLQSHRLLQQQLNYHVEKVARNRKGQSAPAITANRNVRQTGSQPALLALQQYLGLTGTEIATQERSQESKASFTEILAHVRNTIAIKERQANFLEDMQKPQVSGEGLESNALDHKLDELDSMIAEVKESMDQLHQ